MNDLAGKAALEQSNSASLNASINEARAASRAAHDELEATQTKLNEIRIEKGKLEVQVEAAISTIVDECGTPLETALEIPAPQDRAAAEGEAFKMRRRLNSMGTIDSSAAEEYEAMKERYDFMAAQVEDMEAARRSLKRIVAAIDERMQQQFDVTFEQVNENFKTIFAQLFPGGSASLSLVGGEEGQSSLGVEVEAQPRGKKISKMTLHVGRREVASRPSRCFSRCIAFATPRFTFSTRWKRRSTTANLQAPYRTYLATLRNETQLIMITHQRRTMEDVRRALWRVNAGRWRDEGLLAASERCASER